MCTTARHRFATRAALVLLAPGAIASGCASKGKGPTVAPEAQLLGTELSGETETERFDLNGDGSVTKDEIRPARPADAPTPPTDRPDRGGDANHPHPAFPLILALDADQDQVLSSTEIANASASLTALDANADGTLTRDEFLPTPPADAPTGRGGRGGHRGSPPVRK